MYIKQFELLEEDRVKLSLIAKKSLDWRIRERAQTLLYFDAGWTARAIARQQALHLDTVYDRRKHWLEAGFGSLADKPRCGAAPKLNPAQREQLALWASAEALTARQLQMRLKEEFDVELHPGTLAQILKEMNFVWKRTRHSLKKKRDAVRFRQAQQEIADLRVAAERGEIELGYYDESGVALAPVNRSAWTPVGKCHASDAPRGKRLNIAGAMLSSGTLFAVTLWETMTALLFAGFLGLLMEHVARPLVLIVDNASVHTAKTIRPLLKVLERKGLTLYFLPPYSPELNRIEKLWHKLKYEWLTFKPRETRTIKAEVDGILAEFGTRYKMDFS